MPGRVTRTQSFGSPRQCSDAGSVANTVASRSSGACKRFLRVVDAGTRYRTRYGTLVPASTLDGGDAPPCVHPGPTILLPAVDLPVNGCFNGKTARRPPAATYDHRRTRGPPVFPRRTSRPSRVPLRVRCHASEFRPPSLARRPAGARRRRRRLLARRSRRQALPRRVRRRRRLEPRALAARRDRRRAAPGRDAALRAHVVLHQRSRRGPRGEAGRRRAGRLRRRPRRVRRQRLGSDGSRAQARAPALRRARRDRPHALHRAADELPRQHARRAVDRRPHAAARDVRAAADARDAHLAVLRVPVAARGRKRRGVRLARRRRARRRDPSRRAAARRRVHRRAGGRRDARLRAGGARLLRAHPRDLRPPRRAVRRRRGHVRHGPHRHRSSRSRTTASAPT